MSLPPIGIFDSGLGGLTGYRALRRLLPGHPLVSFGDTARVPYGTRPQDEILRFAEQDVRFLLSQSAAAVFVACGTVSSVALPALREKFSVPFTGVVEPACEKAVSIASRGTGAVLVLGTEAAVRSRSFERCLLSMAPDLKIRQKACPLFVPLAENLHTKRGDPAATGVARAYLDPFRDFRPDVIILGCTHFPLLSEIIADVFPGPVLLSAGEEAAKKVALSVSASSLTEDSLRSAGKTRFFTSGDPELFAKDASVYLGRTVRRVAHIAIDRY